MNCAKRPLEDRTRHMSLQANNRPRKNSVCRNFAKHKQKNLARAIMYKNDPRYHDVKLIIKMYIGLIYNVICFVFLINYNGSPLVIDLINDKLLSKPKRVEVVVNINVIDVELMRENIADFDEEAV